LNCKLFTPFNKFFICMSADEGKQRIKEFHFSPPTQPNPPFGKTIDFRSTKEKKEKINNFRISLGNLQRETSARKALPLLQHLTLHLTQIIISHFTHLHLNNFPKVIPSRLLAGGKQKLSLPTFIVMTRNE
jgi:hypothetical protein